MLHVIDGFNLLFPDTDILTAALLIQDLETPKPRATDLRGVHILPCNIQVVEVQGRSCDGAEAAVMAQLEPPVSEQVNPRLKRLAGLVLQVNQVIHAEFLLFLFFRWDEAGLYPRYISFSEIF